MMYGRALRTPLELLRPSLLSSVEARQSAMKDDYDRHAQPHTFSPGDRVLVQESHGFQTSWVPAEVLKCCPAQDSR